jgi:hypothetical protein
VATVSSADGDEQRVEVGHVVLLGVGMPGPATLVATAGGPRVCSDRIRPRQGDAVLRLLGLLLVVWLALTVIGALVEGLFWLAVVGLVFFLLTAVLGWGKQKNRV